MIGKNNPLNIRYSPCNNWLGLLNPKSTRGFCNFRSKEYCFRAAAKLLFHSYKTLYGLVSYEQLISRYAPSAENDTQAYINFVCEKCCVLPFDQPKTLEDKIDMLFAMLRFESKPGDWHFSDIDLISDVLKKYKL